MKGEQENYHGMSHSVKKFGPLSIGYCHFGRCKCQLGRPFTSARPDQSVTLALLHKEQLCF